jgi:hypothetical protein
LELLDDSRNDIFIHVDKKCKDFPFEAAKKVLKHSNCIFTERLRVTWGGYSLIAAELMLLETACLHGTYDYYHLLSGQDLPLKSQDKIHAFFERQQGHEFIRYYSRKFKEENRVRYFYPCQDICGRGNSLFTYPLKCVDKIVVQVQKVIRFSRNKNVKFQKGSQWFSITDSFARYVVERKSWIQRTFRYAYCVDEVFLQTLMINSPYIDKLYHSEFDNDMHAIMRLIIWEGKGPHVFTIDDKFEIENTDLLFGRKFDVAKDKEIVEFVKEIVVKKIV